MQLLADMGIGLDVVHGLRARGDEAVHLVEEHLQRITDDEILAKAVRERRIILTHDLDFSRLVAVSGASLPSVITFRLSDMRPAHVLARLSSVLVSAEQELGQGVMITITDWTVRLRSLPVEAPEEP